MPNVSEKKRKLLCLLKILLEKTDGEHSLTLPQILKELESYGITAERKSIYDDVETLRDFGVKIEKRKSRTFAYSIAERRFSMPELKLVADAVQAAPFLSRRKAAELVGKLETLCSAYQAKELDREVLVPGRGKALGEKALAQMDTLHRAFSEDRQIRFQPMEWKLSNSGKPERAVRKGSRAVTVSPWKLVWTGRHYELLAFDSEAGKLKRCRVEHMAGIELLPDAREGRESLASWEVGKDEEEKLTLEFSVGLLDEIIERFGTEIEAEPSGKNKLRVTVRAALDREFFTWLFSLGTDAKLTAPKKAAEQFREKAKAAAKLYKS